MRLYIVDQFTRLCKLLAWQLSSWLEKANRTIPSAFRRLTVVAAASVSEARPPSGKIVHHSAEVHPRAAEFSALTGIICGLELVQSFTECSSRANR